MNQSDIDRVTQSLCRIADSLEKIEKHLGGEKPKQKITIRCGRCKGTGRNLYPLDDKEIKCMKCSGAGQLITTI